MGRTRTWLWRWDDAKMQEGRYDVLRSSVSIRDIVNQVRGWLYLKDPNRDWEGIGITSKCDSLASIVVDSRIDGWGS